MSDPLGYVRVACAVPELHLADPAANARATAAALRAAAAAGAQVVLCPELGLTGYSCADLLHQETLLAAARTALAELAPLSAELGLVAVVGLPLRRDGRLFNCAAVLAGGRVAGVVPKIFLPTGGEFYEARWFASGRGEAGAIALEGGEVPFGADLLFPLAGDPEAVLGIEICEDLWAVQPPSGEQALAGATILLNPSASDDLLGKAPYRRELVRGQGARCLAAYAYVSAGPGESTTDVVFGGHSLVTENGAVLAEGERFRFDAQQIVADIDVAWLAHERMRNTSFLAARAGRAFRRVEVPCRAWAEGGRLLRPLAARPFVPADPGVRAAACAEITAIQATALARRLRHTGCRSLVLGISGGLDSTLALLVAARAFDLLGLPRSGLVCPTMPGFGTTARTRGNAGRLVDLLGARLLEIPIHEAVRQHFRDIGHDESQHDVTYENAQARERTQVLLDLANKHGGLCLGTGDLSEAALGWCTYGGDHLSMYHVNAGVPKTLVRYLVEWAADASPDPAVAAVLRDIAATPITPELLPTAADGSLVQETEAAVGPYDLHDFLLYHVLRHGSRPAKLLFLAERAFAGRFDRACILAWMAVFYRRFAAAQFKRSCMPDGPKVGTVALSPRGDWRMPSDATMAAWRAEVEALGQR
ncbi:MAG: NAD(+) synthase [Planctomycetes bacterium]|nr:NAD(+) synthase [Planctomycetota bacterium]